VIRKSHFVVSSPDRRVAVALAAGLALFALGCGASNNRGRIEGKWKCVAADDPALDAQMRDAILVFGDDGRVLFERPGVVQPPPATTEGPQPLPNWRYKLLAGDAADFYDLPADAAPRAGLFRTDNGFTRVTIAIENTPPAPGTKYEVRTMTLTDARGQTLRLVLAR